MAVESSPYDEEKEIEESLSEELLLLLASSLLFSVDNIVNSQFTPTDFTTVQDRFRRKLSEALPSMTSTSRDAAQIGIDRATRELKLKDLSVDYSSQQFANFVNDVFDKHIQFISETNLSMFRELRAVALERGWDNAELARRLKDYIGLTPRYLQTILNMESALIADGVKKTARDKLLRKRIDQLVGWRLDLISVQISTEIVEGSKDAAFSYLVSTGQVSISEYEKEWVSVIDENTTQICTSSHRQRARVGERFPNGLRHPPAMPPVHPCRSAIRLAKIIL